MYVNISLGEGNKTTEKTNPSVTPSQAAIPHLAETICTKEVKSCNKNMKILIQSHCNGLQMRFKDFFCEI